MINSKFILPPLSLYIHIPWCVRKCPYCDFNSHAQKGELPEKQYIQQLIKDFESDLSFIQERPIHSIFFGGGTPSLFAPELIATILDTIKTRCALINNIEITLEANPGTVEQKRFEGFFSAGINRLSIGCQSFNDHMLKKLGRIHAQHDSINAVLAAKAAGFENFNLDLMYGLPEQTIDEALNDLNTALALNPTHLSWYQLTLEPNTYFYHNPPSLPADDLIWEMQKRGQTLLKSYGYKHYEISAYARDFLLSEHNLNYWRFGDYIGIGAGAHGKITFPDKKIIRTIKHKHPKTYLESKNFIQTQEEIANQQRPFEFMLNALRLIEPISLALFEERTGLSNQVIEPILKKAMDRGLIFLTQDEIHKTERGLNFLNDLITLFL